MFDRFNEKCVIIDFPPGTCGHFISKVLFEATHKFTQLVNLKSGSCHYDSRITETLPGWFNVNIPDVDAEKIRASIINRIETTKTIVVTDDPVERHIDNVIRLHSYGAVQQLLDALPNSKIINTTIADKREFLISMLFLVTKHSMDYHPSGKLGVVDVYRPGGDMSDITIGKDHVKLSDTEEFDRLSRAATPDELMYIGYQVLNVFIPNLNFDKEYYNGVPPCGLVKDRLFELKFDWILTGQYLNIMKCFQNVIDRPLTIQQKIYIKNEIMKYKSAQNKEIIDDPIAFIRKMKEVHDRVEESYSSTLN